MEKFNGTILSFSLSTQYAVKALHCLAFCEKLRFRLPEIALCTDAPAAYLSKILVVLRENGIVDAKRGPTGGYCLAIPADSISLLDVVNIVGCKEKEAPLPNILTSALWQADQLIRNSLAEISVADLGPIPTEVLSKFNNSLYSPNPSIQIEDGQSPTGGHNENP